METERLLLRRWRDCDKIPFRKINSDPRVMEFYPCVSSPEESDQIIERTEAHFEKQGFGLFAAELKKTGELIGFIGLQNFIHPTPFSPAVEIGWRIAHRYWNLGLATEGARANLDFAFRDLKLSEVIAVTFKGNHRSRRVMEKLGMTHHPSENFDHPHPSLKDSPLKPHVLYRLQSYL